MVGAMLHHLYGLDYEKLYRSNPSAIKPSRKPLFVFGTNATPPPVQERSPSQEIEPDNIASLHVTMYIMGDKYDIPTLRDTAKQHFKKFVDVHAHELAFVPLIKSIYEGTSAGDSGLRTEIINVTLKFRNLDHLRENPDFDRILQGKPDFTYDMLRAVMQKVTRS